MRKDNFNPPSSQRVATCIYGVCTLPKKVWQRTDPGLAWPGVNEDVENAAWVHQLALGRTRWGGTYVPATIGNRHQVGLGVTAATSLVVLKYKGRWHPACNSILYYLYCQKS